MPESAQELTAAMAAGDRRAVEQFYRQYFDLMYSLAYSITRRDEAFCLDVVQDAVLRVVRTVRRVESEAQLAAWLRLVTQTAAYDRLKSESRRRRRETLVAVAANAAESSPAPDETDPERLRWLRIQLDSLDPQIARMIEMRYQRRWTLARMAAALGLSIGTVDGRLRRVLAELRTRAKGLNDE
ncbi:MAG TPA: sigma-70 family RNA polymerase sigma factor [Tepidisphaeraceae bacterium]|nr:sigma-70 family RNA polymerase sigma factor [Tepidisphaeraceae bacterium]